MDSTATRLNVIVVEDHDVLRLLVTQVLRDAGHDVTALSCAEELEDVAGGGQADVFVIDLHLPGEDGLSLSRRVRAAYPLAGILITTARSMLQDRLDGYDSGADIYLSKPVEAAELCAAVAAMGRRRQRVGALLASERGWVLAQQQMTLGQPGGTPVRLSAAETTMLAAFARAPGQRLAYWQIAEILGLDAQSYAKASLEVRIVRLRKKMAEAGVAGDSIEAVRGYGYQLCTGVQVL